MALGEQAGSQVQWPPALVPGPCEGTISARQLKDKLKSRSISVIKREFGSGKHALTVRREHFQGVFIEGAVALAVTSLKVSF